MPYRIYTFINGEKYYLSEYRYKHGFATRSFTKGEIRVFTRKNDAEKAKERIIKQSYKKDMELYVEQFHPLIDGVMGS